MPKINDLDLKNWKKYSDVLTDSLWIIGERDKTGGHNGDYHGNFIPQIPNQLMRRFTKKGDVVLDTFLGSGTTLIESRRLGRNGIGIELLSSVVENAKKNLSQTSFFDKEVFSEIVIGDSADKKTVQQVKQILQEKKKEKVQLIIMHPPYHDIIKFSNDSKDLSNTGSVEKFTHKFGEIVKNYLDLLEKDHFLAIVIGDKYTQGEWIPLSWYLMEETAKNKELKLKGVIVKNMVNNRAKINQQNLWRFRALTGGFYIFKHEYILLFQKR